MSENPYAPPKAPMGTPAEPSPREGEPTTAELRAFVGPRAERYLHHWTNLRSGKSSMAGINVAAFFLGPVWYAYRRMYVEVAVILGSIAAVAVLELILESVVGEIPAALDSPINIAFGVAMGLFANPLYYRRAKRIIATVSSHDPQRRLEEIASRGGTSWAGVVVLLLAVAASAWFLLSLPE